MIVTDSGAIHSTAEPRVEKKLKIMQDRVECTRVIHCTVWYNVKDHLDTQKERIKKYVESYFPRKRNAGQISK